MHSIGLSKRDGTSHWRTKSMLAMENKARESHFEWNQPAAIPPAHQRSVALYFFDIYHTPTERLDWAIDSTLQILRLFVWETALYSEGHQPIQYRSVLVDAAQQQISTMPPPQSCYPTTDCDHRRHPLSHRPDVTISSYWVPNPHGSHLVQRTIVHLVNWALPTPLLYVTVETFNSHFSCKTQCTTSLNNQHHSI